LEGDGQVLFLLQVVEAHLSVPVMWVSSKRLETSGQLTMFHQAAM
jgi:hypothetical protein